MGRTGLWIVLVSILAVGCTTKFDAAKDGTTDTGADTGGDGGDTDPEATACTSDEDCDNGVYCDGAETCNASGVCEDGDPVDCGDDDPCTDEACSEDSESCVYPIVDNDGDDHPAMFGPDGEDCGGDDCNDEDERIHPGAFEECNLVDEDCDGTIFDAAGIDTDDDGVPAEDCGGQDCEPELSDAHGGYLPPPEHLDPAVEPAEEACNGLDDDCNGAPDDADWMECVQGTIVPCTTWCDIEGTGECMECNIPSSDECMEPEEICNGVSDDCDEWADEEVLGEMSTTDISVEPLLGGAWYPRSCYNGDEWGLAWIEAEAVGSDMTMHHYFQIVDDTGTNLIPTINLISYTDSSGSGAPVPMGITCSSSRYAVVAANPTASGWQVLLWVLDLSGAIVADSVVVFSEPMLSMAVDSVDVAYDPGSSDWGVIWTQAANDRIAYRQVNGDGTFPWGSTDETVNNTSLAPSYARIASDGHSYFGVVWQGMDSAGIQGIYFKRVLATGGPVGNDARLDMDGSPMVPDVAGVPDDQTFWLSWVEDASTTSTTDEVFAIHVGGGGGTMITVIEGPLMVSDDDDFRAERPSVDWWPEYDGPIFSWVEASGGIHALVTRLDGSGFAYDMPGIDFTSSGGGHPYHPDISTGRGQALVFWDDGRLGGTGTDWDAYIDFIGCF